MSFRQPRGSPRSIDRGVQVVAALLGRGSAPPAQELVVWHDLGDNGIKWFERMSARSSRRPGPASRSRRSSFPTDQWFGRVDQRAQHQHRARPHLQQLRARDPHRDQTNKVIGPEAGAGEVGDKALPGRGRPRVATYGGEDDHPADPARADGARRAQELARQGRREVPGRPGRTCKRIAVKFRDGDPDGNGKADTFGFALQAAKPRDLIHMLDLFIFGSGLRHTLIDPQGKIVIDEPKHAQVLEEFLKTYTDYRLRRAGHDQPLLHRDVPGDRGRPRRHVPRRRLEREEVGRPDGPQGRLRLRPVAEVRRRPRERAS